MMRALTFIVLSTFSCVWTIDIFIDGPVVLLDCQGHDGTKMFERTTTTPSTEATEELKASSEGRTISVGKEEFLVITQEIRWDEARSWCQQHWGGDLASPNDPQALADRMRAEGLPSDYDWYWLGGQKSGGRWSWLNGRRITTGWGTGQPNDGNSDCVYLFLRESDGALGDYPCSYSWYFICER